MIAILLVISKSNFILVAMSYRIENFLSHVPWLGAMVLSYPDLFPDYKKIRADGQARAMRRIKEGSTSKDLFYHLVSLYFQITIDDSQMDIDG